jgi:hypothetical protein
MVRACRAHMRDERNAYRILAGILKQMLNKNDRGSWTALTK